MHCVLMCFWQNLYKKKRPDDYYFFLHGRYVATFISAKQMQNVSVLLLFVLKKIFCKIQGSETSDQVRSENILRTVKWSMDFSVLTGRAPADN